MVRYNLNTIEMTFTVPSEKINKLLADIKNILMQNVLTPKQLAQITGQLSSIHLAIGPLVRCFCEENVSGNRK